MVLINLSAIDWQNAFPQNTCATELKIAKMVPMK